jgi:hypothetical protein
LFNDTPTRSPSGRGGEIVCISHDSFSNRRWKEFEEPALLVRFSLALVHLFPGAALVPGVRAELGNHAVERLAGHRCVALELPETLSHVPPELPREPRREPIDDLMEEVEGGLRWMHTEFLIPNF